MNEENYEAYKKVRRKANMDTRTRVKESKKKYKRSKDKVEVRKELEND